MCIEERSTVKLWLADEQSRDCNGGCERRHERIRSLSPEPATRKSGSRNRKNTQIKDPFKLGIWNPDTQESEGELPSEEAEVKTGPDLGTDQY